MYAWNPLKVISFSIIMKPPKKEGFVQPGRPMPTK